MAQNIYPPRQLGEGDVWGREIEKKLNALAKDLATEKQKTANLTRASNTQSGSVAQLNQIADALFKASEEQAGGGTSMTDRLNDLSRSVNEIYDRLPVSRGNSSSYEGVSVGTGGVLYGTDSITVPSRKRRAVVSLSLSASLQKPSTDSLNTQLVINGVTIETPRNITSLAGRQQYTIVYSTEMTVEPGQELTFQARFTTATAIPNPSSANPNIIQLTVNIVFNDN